MQPSRLFLMLTFTLSLGSAGCGRFLAERLAQAPNTYPNWIKREMPVQLDFGSRSLSNFQPRFVEVGSPPARLRYRVIEPRNYNPTFTSTSWQEHGRTWFKFTFRQTLPGSPTAYTVSPRGTVVLLHGYSLDQGRMAPWAFRLAQEGWQCVLLDLRGHGKSTGRRIHFGLVETRDLSQLLDELARIGQLVEPVSVLGESYGGALALRWKTVEPRVQNVVAIAAYAELSSAILNIRKQNASFVPAFLVRTGLKHLPEILETHAADLDPAEILKRTPIQALFIAGADDTIMPPDDLRRLHALAAEPSKLLVVPQATHEAAPYFFDALGEPVIAWLKQIGNSPQTPSGLGVAPVADAD